MSFERWQAACAARSVQDFIPPLFTVNSTQEQAEKELLEFQVLRAQILRPGVARRWLIIGGPGSGKTAALRQLAAILSQENELSAYLDVDLLDRLPSFSEPAEFLRAIQPPELDEQLWKARVRKGRIMILLDGINEMEFKLGNSDRWRFVLRLIRGPHPFAVVAASRFLPDDFLNDEISHDVQFARLEPFGVNEIRAYLAARSLPIDSCLAEIEAAGLQGIADNPLLLRLIADHLLDPNEQALPRSRAGLFLSECERAARRSITFLPRNVREIGLSLHAVFSGAMLVAFLEDRASFSATQVADLLQRAWPDTDRNTLRHAVDALSQHHLITTTQTANGTVFAAIHQSIVEFALALMWKNDDLPEWLIERADVGQALGNWVGLQQHTNDAARRGVDLAMKLGLPRLAVDVLIANECVLDRASYVAHWRAVGSFLLPVRTPRHIRNEIASALAPFSDRTAERVIEAGLLWHLARYDERLAQQVGRLLISGQFGPLVLQKLIRKHRREGSDGGVAAAPFPDVTRANDSPVAARKESDDLPALSIERSDTIPAPSEQNVYPETVASLSLGLHAFNKGRSAQQKSISALSDLGSEEALDVLITAISNEAIGRVRSEIVAALARDGSPKAVKALATTLRGAGSNSLRRSAAKSLTEKGLGDFGGM